MEHCRTAVTNVRSQAAAIRKTTAEYLKDELLKGELLTNGDPKWSEVLSSFHVVARQFSDLADDVDPVLSFFAYKPVRPTANAADRRLCDLTQYSNPCPRSTVVPLVIKKVPTFLSTKIAPEAEVEAIASDENLDKYEGSYDAQKAAVDLYNETVDNISKSYQLAAEEVLKNLGGPRS